MRKFFISNKMFLRFSFLKRQGRTEVCRMKITEVKLALNYVDKKWNPAVKMANYCKLSIAFYEGDICLHGFMIY
jgi:hypothetical protein